MQKTLMRLKSKSFEESSCLIGSPLLILDAISKSYLSTDEGKVLVLGEEKGWLCGYGHELVAWRVTQSSLGSLKTRRSENEA
ncbi:hypothetical protein TNCV_4414331 [Trichonephila clavipes]|uniref:Uncharacterized protein n=1 Tax=Trichonephila clavipes TaxID=2585209 RepID=A0A8X6S4B2_TRICX|nr:hypothetical protein TNCV_4414331 [Trichonephila clavipes]